MQKTIYEIRGIDVVFEPGDRLEFEDGRVGTLVELLDDPEDEGLYVRVRFTEGGPTKDMDVAHLTTGCLLELTAARG